MKKAIFYIGAAIFTAFALYAMGFFDDAVADMRARTRAELKAITASQPYKAAENAHWERITAQGK